jgi:hypothetical protein
MFQQASLAVQTISPSPGSPTKRVSMPRGILNRADGNHLICFRPKFERRVCWSVRLLCDLLMWCPEAPVYWKLEGFVLSDQNDIAVLKHKRQLTVKPLITEPTQDFS